MEKIIQDNLKEDLISIARYTSMTVDPIRIKEAIKTGNETSSNYMALKQTLSDIMSINNMIDDI